MNKLGFAGAAALATAFCFSSASAHATGSVADAAEALVTAGTNTGNGGSFVTKAVKDAFGLTDAAFKYYWTYSTLSAERWYTAVTTGDYFTEVSNIADVGADQILAINTVKDANGNVTYAGHAVVIIGDPIDITPPTGFYTPYITGTKQWALPIADSTGSEHGNNTAYPDSRRVSGVFTANIPGTAYMRLYTDEVTGEILSYGWSVTATNEANVFDQSERPFAIGEITF